MVSHRSSSNDVLNCRSIDDGLTEKYITLASYGRREKAPHKGETQQEAETNHSRQNSQTAHKLKPTSLSNNSSTASRVTSLETSFKEWKSTGAFTMGDRHFYTSEYAPRFNLQVCTFYFYI